MPASSKDRHLKIVKFDSASRGGTERFSDMALQAYQLAKFRSARNVTPGV